MLNNSVFDILIYVFDRYALEDIAGAHAAATGRELFGRAVITVGGA